MDGQLAIYPTARKVEDLLKRAGRANGCIVGYRVMTFPQVIEGLWREEPDPRVTIGPVGERLALEQAVVRVRASGVEVADTPGMRERLLALVRQLKSAALCADDVREACQALPPVSRGRIESYAAVLGAYDQLLRENRVADEHERELAVLELLHRAEAAGRRPRFLEGVERLIVAEIYDMSLLQFMIVAALIRIVGDAELTIQAQPHKVSASRFAELTWNRFVAEESIADKVLPLFVRRGGRHGRLGFILEHIFTDEYPTPPGADETVRVIEAPTMMREVEEVARAIRRMLEGPAGERIELARIAIVARDLGAYAGYLETVFARYGIPLNLAQGEPLRSATPARVVMDLLRVAPEGCRREALVSLSNAPYVRAEASRYRGFLAQIGYIDNETRTLAQCVENYQRGIAEVIASAETADERERLAARLKYAQQAGLAWADLAAVAEGLEGQATATQHVERLGAALKRLRFDAAADAITDAGARAAGPLTEALATLAREAALVAPAQTMTLEDFAALAEGVLLDTPLTSVERSAAGVRAMPVLEARGLDFDLVFILGLNDGVFPRYYADDPLVADELAYALNRPLAAALQRRMGGRAPVAPGPILRTRYERNAEEPFLFFLALSMPAHAVVLSYAANDERGNPVARSPFVEEVVRLAGGEEALVEQARATDFIATAQDCFVPGEFINRAVADGMLARAAALMPGERGRIASIEQRIEIERGRDRYLELPTREERESRDESGADPAKLSLAGVYDGNVGNDPRLRRLLLQSGDKARPWSAAQLTELATCAFKYFAHRGLMLREEDEPDYEHSALETGDLAHRVLDEIKRRGIDFGRPAAARGAALEVLEAERTRRQGEARDRAFFNLEWTNLARIIDELIDYEARRRAAGAEAPQEAMPEREIRFSLRDRSGAEAPIDLEIEGRIDLLELYRDARSKITRVRTVDYKTSRNLDKYEKLLQEDKFARRDFQMAVYGMGALEEFRAELAAKVEVEAAYLVLKSRDKEASARFDANLFATDPKRRAALAAAGEQPLADRMIELVRAAAAGRFDVDPLECADYCPYRRICRNHKTGSQT